VKRAVIAVITGLIIWAICATGFDILLRHALPGYAAAEPQLQFTLQMMIARLGLPGALPSIAAGFAGAWISRGSRRVTLALALILLVMFLPAHYRLWTKFPLWYHVTFLGSLLLLTWAGERVNAYTTGSTHRVAANSGAAGDGLA
jgi:hypothetical protein